MEVLEQDQKFIEIATQQKLLTVKEADFCKERMLMGILPAFTALSEGFMSEEEVVEISRQMGGLEFQISAVIVETERRFIEEVHKKNLLDEVALKFCILEQKRLMRMGYSVPLSTIIGASGCLEFSKIAEIYREIGGQPVAVVTESKAFSDAGLPKIRQLAKYLKRKKIKARAQLPAEVQIIQQLQEVIQPPQKALTGLEAEAKEATLKKKRTRKAAKSVPVEVPPEPEAKHKPIEDVELLEASTPGVQSAVASPVEQSTAVTAVTSIPREAITEVPVCGEEAHPVPAALSADAIESLVAQFAAVVEKSLVKFWADEKASEEPDSAEKKAFKQGKQYLSQKEALDMLKSGGAVDKAYISDLKLSDITLPNEISITNSCIENLELSSVVFQGPIDFEGTVFLEKAVFRDSTFEKKAMFRKTLFMDGADFAKVQFAGDAHFNSASFRRYASFNHSEFKQKAVFTRAYFAKGVKFAEVTFGGAASFNDIGCDHRYYMEKCHFEEEATFSNSQFSDIADFSRSKFAKEVKFKGTQFAKWVTFNYAAFAGECHFNGATASGDLSFKWAKFESLINLKTLCGERNVDFNNAKVEKSAAFSLMDAYFGRLFLNRHQVEGHLDSHLQRDFSTAQKEYGLLKNNFREINEYDREDWAYQMEKRMERYGMRVKGPRTALKRFFNWLALDVACGYGTKPLNIFLTSLIALVLFAAGYYLLGSQFKPAGQGLTFWEALLVSFRTFTNATVGGREAVENSWINYIMMFESFLGFFIMTVLVVTFSRKVIR